MDKLCSARHVSSYLMFVSHLSLEYFRPQLVPMLRWLQAGRQLNTGTGSRTLGNETDPRVLAEPLDSRFEVQHSCHQDCCHQGGRRMWPTQWPSGWTKKKPGYILVVDVARCQESIRRWCGYCRRVMDVDVVHSTRVPCRCVSACVTRLLARLLQTHFVN